MALPPLSFANSSRADAGPFSGAGTGAGDRYSGITVNKADPWVRYIGLAGLALAAFFVFKKGL